MNRVLFQRLTDPDPDEVPDQVRLFNVEGLQLKEFLVGNIPKHAIASHNWGYRGADLLRCAVSVKDRYSQFRKNQGIRTACKTNRAACQMIVDRHMLYRQP